MYSHELRARNVTVPLYSKLFMPKGTITIIIIISIIVTLCQLTTPRKFFHISPFCSSTSLPLHVVFFSAAKLFSIALPSTSAPPSPAYCPDASRQRKVSLWLVLLFVSIQCVSSESSRTRRGGKSITPTPSSSSRQCPPNPVSPPADGQKIYQ